MKLTPRRAIIVLAIINFIISFEGGLTIYIDSKYLTSALFHLGLTEAKISIALGIIYALTAAVSLLELIWMPKLLRKFGVRNVAIVGALTMAAGLALFATNPNDILLIVTYPLYSVIPLLIAFDVLAEAYIKEEEVARVRSYIYAFGNFGMLLSPALGGKLAMTLGIPIVYGIASCVIAPVVFIFAWGFRQHVDATYEDTPLFIEPHIKKQTPDLMPIFWTQIMIQSFYMLMVVYAPLILQDAGIDTAGFGKIMTVALAAFVIVPGPLGYFADKYIGEKEFITAGLVIMGAVLLTFPILVSLHPPLWIWAFVFFISRIGAASAESMSDAFFFKKYQTSHPALVVFYRRARPIAQLIFPAIAAILLATGIVPNATILTFIFGFFLITSAIFPLRITDTK